MSKAARLEVFVKFLKFLKGNGGAAIFKKLKSMYFELIYSIRHRVGKSVVTSSYGVVMRKNWKDATFRFCIEGRYGAFLSDHLRHKNTHFHFLDIGANQGLYTLIAAQNPCCVNAICFEPVKRTFLNLVENIHLNKVAEKTTVLNFGLGIKPERVSIFLKENHSGAASQISPQSNERTTEETIEIVTAQILSFLPVVKPIQSVICKIDVEGKESDVLQTLIGCKIIESIDELFYEVNEHWTDPLKIQEMLEKEGFKVFQKIGDNSTHYDVLARR